MDRTDIAGILRAHGQEHLLRFWDSLNAAEQAALAEQVRALDFAQIARMKAMLPGGANAVDDGAQSAPDAGFAPAPVVQWTGPERDKARAVGEQALRDGRVGVILVAGGQGSRLGFEGPKGTLPLAPITNATLFEIHARKILALRRRWSASVPFYIMTSTVNDADTRRFFAERGFCGLPPADVLFFTQGMYPALGPDGRIVLERPGRIALAPDGHGGLLAALDRTGMLQDMARRGLTTLFYFQVDNPLVDIADPAFLGLHLAQRADMSLKVCAKRNASEGLGVVVVRGARLAVVEYTELTDAQKNARRPDGTLVYQYGSVAIHVFARTFLEREAAAGLPLHLAHKKVPCCDDQGGPVKPVSPNAYKFEKFIFDALPHAHNAVVLAFDRAEEFAPVKNAAGDDSPDTARAALMEKFARWLAAAGVAVPRRPDGSLAARIEIDPCHASGPEDLAAKLPRPFAVGGEVLLRADDP